MMIRQTEAGFVHPAEETEKLRACETVLVETFQKWGYREAETPVIDRAEILETETSQAAYRLLDSRGQVMVLRPDWTTPIAHLATIRSQPEMLPLRLFYRGSVFRREDMQARELHQTGVEILGAGGDLADGEVVSLAVQSLAMTGLLDFRIGIGHVRFLAGLMNHWQIEEPVRTQLQNALSRRDFVSFRRTISQLALPEAQLDFLQILPELHGDMAVLAQAREADPGEEAVRALDTLAHVYGDLQNAGMNRHIYLDLGMIRDQEYYTGIVFEGYTRGLGHPVLGGGRYDHLTRRFGAELPATGFAVHMERLLAILPGSANSVREELILVIPHPGAEAAAIRKAEDLRQTGQRVILEINGRGMDEARTFARQQGCTHVLTWQKDRWVQEDLQQGGINDD